MKFLTALTTISGLGWAVAFLGANQMLADPSWAFVVSVLGYLAVSAVVLLTTRSWQQLPSRLVALWALAVLVVAVSLAPTGGGLTPLLGAALLFGTIGFAIWLSLPLVAFSVAYWRPTR